MTQTVKTTTVKTTTTEVETTAGEALQSPRALELTPVIALHVPQRQTG
jgi:hypothetical protein